MSEPTSIAPSRSEAFPRGTIILLAVFVLSLPAVTPRLYAADEIEYFAFLRSLWFDHDLSFDNEYRYFYDRGIARAYGFHHTFLELTSETGHRLNFGTIGPAFLWAPMYGIADVYVRMARARGATIPADGFSRPYLAAVAYGSAVYGFLAVLLSANLARRLTGNGDLASAVVWIGTPLLFYTHLAPGMAHACSAFAVAAFVVAWISVRERWSMRGVVGLGALAALMTMVREQDAFCVLGVVVDFAWGLLDEWRGRRVHDVAARLRSAAGGAAAFAVCMLPQAWAYMVLNGHLGPSSIVSNKMQWLAPHALQVLFSPEHGLFVWTPLAFVCVVGLLLALRRSNAAALDSDRRRIVICLLVIFAAQVYVTGSVGTWTVAGSFGQRRFVALSVVFIIGLALWLRTVGGGRRLALWAAIVVSTWWNLGLMAQFGAGLMDRQRLEPARNAYNTFIVVPKMLPGLAYRYVFDRSSFFLK
jgi:hypothetical protein